MWSNGHMTFMTLWVGASHSKHHPLKFGDHSHCGSGDINIPVNAVIYTLTSAIIISSKTHGMSYATRVSNNN